MLIDLFNQLFIQPDIPGPLIFYAFSMSSSDWISAKWHYTNLSRCEKMVTMRLLALLLSSLLCMQVECSCPHPEFVSKNICDSCRGWRDVLQHQVSAGATGITAVLGPAPYTFPPLFRQNGPYSRYSKCRPRLNICPPPPPFIFEQGYQMWGGDGGDPPTLAS